MRRNCDSAKRNKREVSDQALRVGVCRYGTAHACNMLGRNDLEMLCAMLLRVRGSYIPAGVGGVKSRRGGRNHLTEEQCAKTVTLDLSKDV